MRKTSFLTALALVALAAPVHAQGGGMGNMNMDPTTAVKGSGTLPAGWTLRFDPARTRPGAPPRPAPELTAVNFITMGSGYHITTGPAAIYYMPKDVAKGNFKVSATFAQRKTLSHEAYGMFIGGSNLQDSTQNYLYFVVRPVDGMVQISHRSSNAAPKTLVPYFASDAVNKDDPTDGHATNKLGFKVDGDHVDFLVNDKVVKTLKKSELDGANTDGLVGLRVNHNSDLHISDYKLDK
jgi:hypothetical protein